jgi:DNA polymerase-3 subunit delta'
MIDPVERLIENGRIPNTLLLTGPKEANLVAAALRLATSLLGEPAHQHPDLHHYLPDTTAGLHSIEAMRRLIEEVYMAPFRAPAKVFIIEDAERMLPTSSNALLKTLEEPSLHCYILLLTPLEDAILPTILSRCRKISFQAPSKQPLEKTPQRDLLVQFLAQPLSFAERLKILSQLEEESDPEALLNEILYWQRDRHLLASGADPSYLYFSAYHEALRNCSLPFLPLEHTFALVEKARHALQHHLKLRTTLLSYIRHLA